MEIKNPGIINLAISSGIDVCIRCECLDVVFKFKDYIY